MRVFENDYGNKVNVKTPMSAAIQYYMDRERVNGKNYELGEEIKISFFEYQKKLSKKVNYTYLMKRSEQLTLTGKKINVIGGKQLV